MIIKKNMINSIKHYFLNLPHISPPAEKRDDQTALTQLQDDLQLTIDWNRPDIAVEIFQAENTKVRVGLP